MLVCISFVSSTHTMENSPNKKPEPSAPEYEYQPYPMLSSPIPIPQRRSVSQPVAPYMSNSVTPSANFSHQRQNSSSMLVSPSSTPTAPFFSPNEHYQYQNWSTPTPSLENTEAAKRPALFTSGSPTNITSTAVTYAVQAGYSVCMPAQGTQNIPCVEATCMKTTDDFATMLNQLPAANRVQYVMKIAKTLNNDGCITLAKFAALKGTKTANGEERNLHNTNDQKVKLDAQLALAALQKALPPKKAKKWF